MGARRRRNRPSVGSGVPPVPPADTSPNSDSDEFSPEPPDADLDRLLILGEGHLRAVLPESRVHCNTARSHRAIAQHVPDGEHDGGHLTVADLDRGRILQLLATSLRFALMFAGPRLLADSPHPGRAEIVVFGDNIRCPRYSRGGTDAAHPPGLR